MVGAVKAISEADALIVGGTSLVVYPAAGLINYFTAVSYTNLDVYKRQIIDLTAIFYQDNVMGAASLVSFGAVCGFFMVNLSVISHYIIRGKERGAAQIVKHLIIPAIGMVSLIVVFIYMETAAKILGGLWLLVGIIYLSLIHI